ncbi:vomeronasal type-1 receptor 2-like [Eschrichtius robustus]|uniref:vomeronasal type-1 receptor 2-like n=1 Tax=Eschrichtius robustus TaxID=9764 RepID=UPI0035BFF02B
MPFMDLKFVMIFLFQIGIGILGNFSLLYHYVFLYLSGPRSRSTDLIFKHLTIANSLVILSRGIPETTAAFGLKDFLRDFGCKLVFSFHRVARGVSMGTTCLLNIFQAIAISPSNSKWAELKVRALKFIGPTNILCWILNMLLNTMVPMHLTGKWNNKNITKTIDFGYCSSKLHNKDTDLLFIVLVSSHDVLCLGHMTWANGSVVSILYRHKQRVQRILGKNVSPRSSPLTKATQSILVLVSTFVCFYTLSSIIYFYFIHVHKTTWWLVYTSALIKACFPTASPFVLWRCVPCISRHLCVCTRKSAVTSSHQNNVNSLIFIMFIPFCPHSS